MENLEVQYPTGIFGLPELRNEQTHRHMAAHSERHASSASSLKIRRERSTPKVSISARNVPRKLPSR